MGVLDDVLKKQPWRVRSRRKKRRKPKEPESPFVRSILKKLKGPPPNPLRDPFAGNKGTPGDPHGSKWDQTGDQSVAGGGLRGSPEFAPVDVLEIRGQFHMTQRQFARMIGISVHTLRNWEQGRRQPQGPARSLLRVANANPNHVAAVLLRYKRVWWMDWEK